MLRIRVFVCVCVWRSIRYRRKEIRHEMVDYVHHTSKDSRKTQNDQALPNEAAADFFLDGLGLL